MIPTELLAPLAALGLPGVIIGLLVWALIRKDTQVEKLQEARVQDQKERAADNLRAAEVIEKMNQAARQREEASDGRWRVMESIGEAVRATAKAVEVQGTEIIRVGRIMDQNALRLERLDGRPARSGDRQ